VVGFMRLSCVRGCRCQCHPVYQCRLRGTMANRKRWPNDADKGDDWQRGGVRIPCKPCL